MGNTEIIKRLFEIEKEILIEQKKIQTVFEDYDGLHQDGICDLIMKLLGYNENITDDIEGIGIYDIMKISNDGHSIVRFKEYDDVYELYFNEEIEIDLKIVDLKRILKAYFIYKLKEINND